MENEKSDEKSKTNFMNSMNLNIDDYTIDDIFNLLDITIDETTNYIDLKDIIISKIQKYIIFFQGQQNIEIVNFFKKSWKTLYSVRHQN